MKSALDQALARLERNVKGRSQTDTSTMPKVQAPQEPQEKATVVYLPVWPESARGVPNSALRGALFAAIQSRNRVYMNRQLLAVQQGVEIRFTGMQLNQSDMDVFEQALHLARQQPLGTCCDFIAHSFLKALGWRTGKSQYEQLKDSFARLNACSVEITHNHKTYFGSLIERGVRDEITGLYVLEINPEIMALYTEGWTACDWEQRKQLRGKPLALWLHGFYATHAKPFPMKIETLIRLSGSNNKNRRSYISNLKNAHDDLRAVSAIDSYTMDDDFISVERIPSNSQKKHLQKAKSCKK